VNFCKRYIKPNHYFKRFFGRILKSEIPNFFNKLSKILDLSKISHMLLRIDFGNCVIFSSLTPKEHSKILQITLRKDIGRKFEKKTPKF